jgi:hypothetical protein
MVGACSFTCDGGAGYPAPPAMTATLSERPVMPPWERWSQSPRTRRSPLATSSMIDAGGCFQVGLVQGDQGGDVGDVSAEAPCAGFHKTLPRKRAHLPQGVRRQAASAIAD